MPIRFDHPAYLLLLLLAAPIVWLGLRSLATLERPRQWAAIVLRCAVLVVLTLMLAGLQAVRWHDDLTVVAVADRSESVRRFAQPPTAIDGATGMEQWVEGWLTRAAGDRRVDDRLGYVTFDGRPTVRAMPSPSMQLDSGMLEDPREGTDIAAAVRLAMALYPADTSRRMVLISDGLGATGAGDASDAADLLAAAREAAAAGVPIDVLPLEYTLENEVMVDGVYAPIDARQRQTISLRVVLRAAQPAAGRLVILHDDQPIETDTRVETTDWTGDVLVKRVDIPLQQSGANRFEAIFEPDDGYDAMPANNRGSALTLVSGQGQLLILNNVPGDSGMILPTALRQRGIESTVAPSYALPQDATGLQRYDAVVLQNVPNEAIPPAQQQMLARYVSDLGGGLVMIGGPDSFGAGGWANTPIDRILPVACEIPKQKKLPAGALVIVIDRSGSMNAAVDPGNLTKQQVANRAAVLAVSTLFAHDYVGVLAFSDGNKWIRSLGPYNDLENVHKQILDIATGGGTNIYDALVRACDELISADAPHITVKHIIMLTDGQGKGGDYDALIAKMKAAGITLSTIGVGNEIDGDLLKRLALSGGGAFHPVLDPNNLPQVFIKEARQVRKALIREIPFEPRFLTSSSPITSGMRQTPLLRGLVITAPKEDPRVFLPMVGPEGEPLFAHWQVGVGRTAAFTSDAHNRWASPWLDWPGYTDFWARTMRAIARPAASKAFELATDIHDNTLRIRLDVGSVGVDPNRAATAAVLAPDGQTQKLSLMPTGPGVYEATAPAPQEGHYLVSAFIATEDGGPMRYVYSGASRTRGAELRAFRSDREVLMQVADLTGGRVLDPQKIEANALFARDGSLQRSRSVRPVWRGLLWALLVLLMLDIANRRLAWDWTALLKRKRKPERARAVQPEPQPQPESQPTPQPTSTSELQPESRAPKPESRSTSRLLDAKRRARQQYDDQEQ